MAQKHTAKELKSMALHNGIEKVLVCVKIIGWAALSLFDDLLAAANSSKADMVKVTVLMTDIDDYAKINDIYGEWLGDTIPPARAAYEVAKLPMGALVEIVCEAFRNSGEFRTDLPAELEEALV